MNYLELVEASKAYADRQDLEVEDQMDTFILMAESRINRLLKVRGQTHRIYTDTFDNQEYYPLPDDYAGMRYIKYNFGDPDTQSGFIDMDYLTPESFSHMKNSDTRDGRVYYTIIASQIETYPTLSSDGTIEAVYYRKVPNLNKINNINWLLTDYPDIYLAAVVLEIEAFVKNYQVADQWGARLVSHIDELKNSDISERWAGGEMTIKVVD